MSEVTVTPTRTARRPTPTWLLLLMIVIGLALLIVLPIATWLFQQDLPSFSVIIEGAERVNSGALSLEQRFVLVVLMFAAVIALLIALPVALLFVLALGVGVPLLAVLLVTFALFSPILLLLALVRRIWRASTRGFGPNISA